MGAAGDGMAVKDPIHPGVTVHVQVRPSYWATVTWSADLPHGRATVQPLPNQAVSERKRTVWKDRLTVVRR